MSNEIKKGTTYWVTGLAGAGKTTIGGLLYDHIRETKNTVIRLDGDILRYVYGDWDYSAKARETGSFVDSRLCGFLNEQGMDVVISVMDMFDSVRACNRENIENYVEIYLRVPIEELIRRDQKQLYSRALRNEIPNVMGINMEYDEPKQPDIIIDNWGENTPESVLNELIQRLKI